MIPSAPAPSDDPAALQVLLAAERLENERPRKTIRELQRHRFGRRAESLPLDQLQLELEEAKQAEAADEAGAQTAAPTVRATRVAKRRANRGFLPAYLPRIDTVVDIADHSCPCCSGPLHRIGEDVSERLDVVPAQFRVLVVRRPRYACRACTNGLAQAPVPARLIEGGLPTDATVAQVLVSKYVDHLPLYRQAQIFARQGVNLDRSTLADWVGRAALLLEPVHRRLLDHLRASTKLFADETTAPVLDPGRGRTKTEQLWSYARDDRPWCGADPPAVAYVYAPDRKAERPMAHLAGFTGVLQVNGYEGYRALTKGGAVRLAFCWAHVRRGFIDLAAKGASPIAAEVLARIAALYRIESETAGLPAEERRKARAERIQPLLTALAHFLRDKLALFSQKSKLVVAICYATSCWDGLKLYADDGRVEMDSNTVERSIRPLALIRKNALSADSDRGGQTWALIASFVETCKLNGVEWQSYLCDVITRIVGGHPIVGSMNSCPGPAQLFGATGLSLSFMPSQATPATPNSTRHLYAMWAWSVASACQRSRQRTMRARLRIYSNRAPFSTVRA